MDSLILTSWSNRKGLMLHTKKKKGSMYCLFPWPILFSPRSPVCNLYAHSPLGVVAVPFIWWLQGPLGP